MIKQLIKKQRGVTLSMLLITIILVAILIGVTVANLDMGNDIKKYNYMCADIELLESKVLTYYNENKSLPIVEEKINLELIIDNISDYNPKDNDTYYEIDLNKLNNISLNLGKGNKENKDIYVINEQSHAIYYLKGVVYEGNTYHRPMEALGGGTGPAKTLLPAEYQQVEYIESTGTQYIDTGWIPTINAKIDLDIMLSENGNTNVANGGVCIFADYTSADDFVFGTNFGGASNEYKRLYFWVDKNYGKGGSVYQYTFNTVTDRTHLIVASNKASFQGIDINIAQRTGASSRNLLLLAKPASEGIEYTFNRYNAKIYSCKIYDGENLVRDFIPCYKKEGNVTGLYDIVNDVFYPNQGTGNFNVGPIKENIINASQGTLPSLYQQVEYLESSGTQYIDTEFIPNQDTRVIVDYEYTVIDNTFLFGTRTTNTSNAYTVNIANNATQAVSAYGTSGNVQYGTPDTERHIIDKNKNLFYVDGDLKLTQPEVTFTCPGSLEIFAAYHNGTEGYLPSSTKIYSFKIYDNDVLVRDFIPCYRKSDNVAGLYDLVNDVFYTNAGTGEFVVGANVGPTVTPTEEEQPDEELPETILPEDYQQVEYLESTGTQYIDTRTILNQDSVVEIDFEITEAGNYNVFGSRTSGEQNNIGIIFSNKYNEAYIDFQNYTVNRLVLDYNLNRNMYKISNQKLQCGESERAISSYTDFITPENAYIFSISGGAPLYDCAKMKLYSCKIYNGTTLIRDFIPCYRKADNVAGLYDLANDVFYTNAGTGTFTVGENV